MLDTIENIKHTHDKIARVMLDVSDLAGSRSRLKRPLFDRAKKELLILQKAEEDVLYEELEGSAVDKQVKQLQKENETIKSLIHSLSKQDIYTDEWDQEYIRLQKRVFKQFDREESKLLDKNEEDIIEDDQLAENFDDKKRELWKTESFAVPVAPSEDFSKVVRKAA